MAGLSPVVTDCPAKRPGFGDAPKEPRGARETARTDPSDQMEHARHAGWTPGETELPSGAVPVGRELQVVRSLQFFGESVRMSLPAGRGTPMSMRHNDNRHEMRRSVWRFAASAAVMTLLMSGPAHAISVKEIIELSRAGVSEEVLVALVQTGRTVFTLDANQILALKSAGVSDRVVLAMTDTGRPAAEPATGQVTEAPTEAAAGSDAAGQQWLPALGGVVGGTAPHEEAPPATVVVIVPAPVFLPFGVPQATNGSRHVPPQPYLAGYRGFGRFINDGFVDNTGSRGGYAGPGRFINDGTRLPPAPRKRP